jgi:hypothetical protein
VAKHYVSNEDTSLRIFRHDLLESLSQVHYIVPHLIFWPVVGYLAYRSAGSGLGLGTQVLAFAAGVLTWTFCEYTIHRFVFHAPPHIEIEVREALAALKPGEPALEAIRGWHHVFYFFAHGVHHDFPSDSKRLVMPPSVSIPLAAIFWFAFRLVLGPQWSWAVFAGFLVGYLAYDTIHYAVHHFSLRSPALLYLKKLHFRHHYGDPAADFGVSSPLWDFVFRTASPATRGEADR